MISSGLIIVIFLFSHVASHGQVFVPRSRNIGSNTQGCYIKLDKHYVQGFRCKNMCGNSLDLETGEIDPRWENTRPVVATYKMGQIMQMKLSNAGHPGYTRLRLCKLSKSTDVVNQKCLDQNLLEIKNIAIGDKLTLRDKFTIWNTMTDFQNITLDVKLPDGLECDNCVLQWEWLTTVNCRFANGTMAPTEYCPHQMYKNCMDIKIERDASRPNQVYTPNIVQSIYPKTPKNPPVYYERGWTLRKDEITGKIIKPVSDPLQYIGTGLICLSGNYKMGFNSTLKCRENCMSPATKCPDECYCRWFEYDPLHSPRVHPYPSIAPYPAWGQQCGGIGYTGVTNCGPFAKCVQVNQNLHRCQGAEIDQ